MNLAEWDQCGKKKAYSRRAVDKIKKHRQKVGGKKLRTYQCPYCFQYHLTSLGT